ncbi:MAG TPA: ATP-binding cassette domain-containing protein [Cyclobacteriaceae bacterium]|jgi:ABC-type multidrug transport system ATPase subunit|nr:ABC transporter ATP-binding protein [Cytophagales bacterium]HRE66723.1 ATP-binding cassette domain-containing protein [Cyclobacteriaceae bacterium]HRF33537.1 ATP-binding cassette domain-containing protein [Cyclobacteriaceae bacterium]
MKIEAKDLSKRFNREWIFKNLNFQFTENRYAIVGPNGSGKSTLLQILWGQMLPSKGELSYSINNTIITADEVFKHVAIATPYLELIDEFTLTEMVDFHFHFKKPRHQKNTQELLELFELSHAHDKTIANFSSGMRQRLKLGLAFYSQTEFLFLDEPTTNLDKKAIAWYQQHLAGISAETMVIIASNQEHEYPATAVKLDILDYK